MLAKKIAVMYVGGSDYLWLKTETRIVYFL
jgi:hypothetical protein